MKIRKNTPCVYFVSDGHGHCKIGVASDLYNRISNLQVGCPYEITLIHVMYFDSITEATKKENQLHHELKEYRIRGEWFEQNFVQLYLSCKELPKKDNTHYLCDQYPKEFNFADIINQYLMLLESKTPEEYVGRYEKETPDYIKQFDEKRFQSRSNKE